MFIQRYLTCKKERIELYVYCFSMFITIIIKISVGNGVSIGWTNFCLPLHCLFNLDYQLFRFCDSQMRQSFMIYGIHSSVVRWISYFWKKGLWDFFVVCVPNCSLNTSQRHKKLSANFQHKTKCPVGNICHNFVFNFSLIFFSTKKNCDGKPQSSSD